MRIKTLNGFFRLFNKAMKERPVKWVLEGWALARVIRRDTGDTKTVHCYCPVAFVFNSDSAYPGDKKLDPIVGGLIRDAADNHQRIDPALRARLLKACKLA